MPALDSELFGQCLYFRNNCASGDGHDRYCEGVARTHEHAVGALMACWADHGCEASPACNDLFELKRSTLGTAVCGRASQCDLTCGPVGDIEINIAESTWRPFMAEGLRRCIAEESCSEFEQCANAYGAAASSFWQPLGRL
jgi:hypothetical protein